MKVAICGLGDRIATVFSYFHRASDDIELVGYADPHPYGLAHLQAAEIDAGRAYADLPTLLRNESPDLLMVGSPNHLHLEHIRHGLEAGVRIFAEKPVVLNEAQTYEMLALLREYGERNVMVGLVLRYSQNYRDLVHCRDSGFLGKIVSVEANEHIAPWHGAFFMRDWRRHEKYSGGFLLEKCCHDLDLHMGLLQDRPSRLASFGGRGIFVEDNQRLENEEMYNRWPGRWRATAGAFGNDGDIIDHQVAILEFSGMRTLSFHTSLNSPDTSRRFYVVGTEGVAEGDFERAYLRVHSSRTGDVLLAKEYAFPGGGRRGADKGHYGSEELMTADILAHLAGGAQLPVSVVDALAAGLVAMKIDQARKSGVTIDLAEDWARFDSYGLTQSGLPTQVGSV